MLGCGTLILGLIIMLIGSIFIGPLAIFLVPLPVLLFWMLVGLVSSFFSAGGSTKESRSSHEDKGNRPFESYQDDDLDYAQPLERKDHSDIWWYDGIDAREAVIDLFNSTKEKKKEPKSTGEVKERPSLERPNDEFEHNQPLEQENHSDTRQCNEEGLKHQPKAASSDDYSDIRWYDDIDREHDEYDDLFQDFYDHDEPDILEYPELDDDYLEKSGWIYVDGQYYPSDGYFDDRDDLYKDPYESDDKDTEYPPDDDYY